MERKTIIHVPRRFALDEWGGTESVIYHLCREQQEAGWQPEIHTSKALAQTPTETWRGIPIKRYGYTYPFLGLTAEEKLALDKKGGNLLSFSLLPGLARRNDVDIFHAHVTKRMGATVRTAARLRKRPFVVTLHGNIFDVPKDEADSIVAAQKNHFEWGRPFGMLLGSRDLLEHADAVICVGYSEYEAAKGALPHDRVYHLPNGVAPDSLVGGNRQAARQRLGVANNDFLFGCISRIDHQKNQRLLVDAWAAVYRKHPHARLVLVGPATRPDYADELRHAIAAVGADAGKVLPPVEVESDEHRDLLAALDCFVLPSRHEPFGIVILEAWAAGKPVIASHVGGLQRLIRDGETGLHFPSGNTDALATMMTNVMENADLAKALAVNGNREVNAKYTWKTIASQQADIYSEARSRFPR